jgi:hypothetical protein
MFNNSKYFIYRGFEIIENLNSFNIYYENDKLLKIIPKDNKQSFKVVETFINEYLRKEN